MELEPQLAPEPELASGPKPPKQSLRKRPAPVAVTIGQLPQSATTEPHQPTALRLLTGYTGSQSFADDRKDRGAASDSDEEEGGGKISLPSSPRSSLRAGSAWKKVSPKLGPAKRLPETSGRQGVQPLEVDGLREKLERISAASATSSSGNASVRQRKKGDGGTGGSGGTPAHGSASPRMRRATSAGSNGVQEPGKLTSFWGFLLEECLGGSAAHMDASNKAWLQRGDNERVHDTLAVPRKLERLLNWGTLLCIDSFLFLFTFLPIRVLCALPRGILRAVPLARGCCRPLRPDEAVDLTRGFILLATCALLSRFDVSKIYHSIRGQAMIKLYVIVRAPHCLLLSASAFCLDA